MKALLTNLLTGIAALGLASQAAAQVDINLSLQPSPQTINVGDPASMDLVVSGLANLSAPSLGAFDFDLFSTRWTGYIVAAESGKYSISLSSNDGGRLLLDDKKIIDLVKTSCKSAYGIPLAMVRDGCGQFELHRFF